MVALWAPAWKGLTSLPSCVFCFVTFPYGVPGQVWYLVVSIPDLYFLYGIATALINISITMMNSFHEHIPGIMVLGPCTLYLQPHNLAVWEV